MHSAGGDRDGAAPNNEERANLPHPTHFWPLVSDDWLLATAYCLKGHLAPLPFVSSSAMWYNLCAEEEALRLIREQAGPQP